MSNRFVSPWTTFVLAAVVLWGLAPAVVIGQGFAQPGRPKGAGAKTWLAERAKLPPFTPPRLPDGRPDLQGRWGGSSSGDDLEETEMVDATTPAWESWISNPADGKIPYQPWALAVRKQHRAGLARGVEGESEVLRYMLQNATLSGRDALGRSTISLPLNDWLFQRLSALQGSAQRKEETAPAADLRLNGALLPSGASL